MGKPSQYAHEVRERVVRMVLDRHDERASHWAATQSIGRIPSMESERLYDGQQQRGLPEAALDYNTVRDSRAGPVG